MVAMEKMLQEIEKNAAKHSDEFIKQLASMDNTSQTLAKATSSAGANLRKQRALTWFSACYLPFKTPYND